jgi:hypothetical protein
MKLIGIRFVMKIINLYILNDIKHITDEYIDCEAIERSFCMRIWYEIYLD